jgi:TPR repeat protein
MPVLLLSCISLPPATILSVPINDFASAHEELANKETEQYYACCGKSICRGCVHSFTYSVNSGKCPFCNSDRTGKTDDEQVEELTKRAEANDAASIGLLACSYLHGLNGIQQDQTKAIELYVRAANLGYSKAHYNLGGIYLEGGNMKKAKSHWEAAAMAGHETARCIVGNIEFESRNMERAMKHWKIAALAGDYRSMQQLKNCFEKGLVTRESNDSTLIAYNNSCVEMRSEARDACIQFEIDRI